jgi:molybdenum ABC transporter molybdate-binding protein
MRNQGQEWMNEWTVGVRLWLERSGEAILGPGRLELLEAIERCHSISAAARELGMSYRRAWLLVDSINRAAGDELVRRQTGGIHGGGAELTGRGHAAIRVYRELQARVRQTASAPLPTPLSSSPSIVHVAAASSLDNVLHCLIADFAVKHPTVSVRAICGASDELVDPVLSGVHVDLFLSAADTPLDRLQEAGVLAADSRAVLCANRLAAITAIPRIPTLRSPGSLLRAEVRSIALADVSCPLGAYTRAYLESLEVWETVRQRAMFLDNPRVVVAAVESGQAEVGLVYLSDARASRACRVLFRTAPGQPAIRYTAALTRFGNESPPARALLDFLTSRPAHRRFQRYGFLIPGAARSQRGT